MPARKKTKGKGRSPGETIQSQFRLGQDTLADLDRIATHLTAQGLEATRTDAVRFAARDVARRLQKDSEKSSPFS